ncbi:metal-binding protein [Pyrobaculum aerophilum]|uniref:metal-binding protein n=1 Tax=Pyrobaculum aerophilum TaxID=13773 RepID=UPI002FDB2D44
MRCPMLRSTADGLRCVLIPPEEWRTRKAQLEKYCNNAGNGCPIYAQYLAKKGNA